MIKVRKFYRGLVDKWQESQAVKKEVKQETKVAKSFDDSDSLPF